VSDPNEYLRRICASADLLTKHADVYEGSGIKRHVDETVDRMLADGLNLSVDSVAGFMLAVGLISMIDDELCELDPIRRVSRVVGSTAIEPHAVASAVGSSLGRADMAGGFSSFAARAVR